MKYKHEPVMIDEVLEYLNPQSGGKFIDCTLGGGGYTFAIADKVGSKGLVIAFDLDELAIKNTKQKIKNSQTVNGKGNIILIHDNFKNLQADVNEISKEKKQDFSFDGIVLDLGLSSAQLEDRGRGFSFLVDAPLNMAFGQDYEVSTKDIVNKTKEEELARIFKEYGEEKFARLIARKIIAYRKEKEINSTKELAEITSDAIPKKFQKNKIHPATKVFQALRIATNKELQNLEEVLPQALNLLKPGGRIVVVSFHSLEDRIVKNYFRKESKECICPPRLPVCNCGHKRKIKIINKKIITPSQKEITKNPRARSAKFRAAEKI